MFRQTLQSLLLVLSMIGSVNTALAKDAVLLAEDPVIEQRLSSEVVLIGQISRYIVAAGGKRLRPALLLLMCGARRLRGELKPRPIRR